MNISAINNSVNFKLQSYLDEDDENVRDIKSIKEFKDFDPMKSNKYKDALEDLKKLRNLMINLRSKHNSEIAKEVDNIIREYYGNDTVPSESFIEKENKVLKHKLEEIDKKFETILKENKELKRLIKNKTIEIEKLNSEMLNFKKELRAIKVTKNFKTTKNTSTSINKTDSRQEEKDFHKLNEIKLYKTRTDNKNRSTSNIRPNLITNNTNNLTVQSHLISKTPTKKRGKDILKDLYKLDTIELMKRANLDDPKKVLYLPIKVNSSAGVEPFKVPRLDIVRNF